MNNPDSQPARLQQTHAALDSVMRELEAALAGDPRALAALRRIRSVQAELAPGTIHALCA